MAKEKLPMSGSASFGKIVNQLGQATKKPAQTKAPVVLAVQIVDKTGKVVEDKKGAAVAEAQREEEKREKKKLTLLERIADSLGGKGEEKKGAGAGNKGGFLKSILPGLLPAGMIGAMGAASLLGKLGIGAVVLGGIWAAVTAIGDGIKGMKWAKEMGMEKETGFIAGFFGGSVKGGLMNAFKQSMKGAAMGATLGMAGGPIGMIIGALLGAALFGIAGFFGAGALAKMIDPLVQSSRKLFGLAINVTPKELADAKKVAEETGKLKDNAIGRVEDLVKQLEEAQSATEPDQKLIDKLILLKAEAMKTSLKAHKNHEKAATKALELDRQSERTALIAAEDAVKKNNMEILHLNQQKRKFESAVTMYGKDTKEGQLAAANLDVIRVKLRQTRAKGQKLRDDEEKAEAVLLEEDRRLIKEAKAGGDAPWRARFNVFTSDFPKMMEEFMKPLTDWFSKDVPSWLGEMVTNIKEYFWAKDGKSGILQFTLPEIKLTMPKLDFDIGSMLTNPFAGILDSINQSDFFKDANSEANVLTSPFEKVKGILKEALISIFGSMAGGSDDLGDLATGREFAAGGTFSKGRAMLVGELGPELILPSTGGQVINAQRSQQMLQAGMQRGMGSGAGGGITSINTGGNVVSSPTTNFVGSGIAARRPIVLRSGGA